MVEIVAIFPTAGDCKDTRSQYVGQAVRDPGRVAVVGYHGGQLRGQPKPSVGLREKHNPAVRTDPATIEGGRHFLAVHGWKGKRKKAIVGHGGCGAPGDP